MKWLDSKFAKFTQFLASVIGIASPIVGAALGNKVSPTWTGLIAGSFFGLLVTFAIITTLVLVFRHDCRFCDGTGRIYGERVKMHGGVYPRVFRCEVCNGKGFFYG